jgi:hypothetical protein
MVFNLLKATLCHYSSFFHNDDSVNMLKEINSMSHKDPGVVSQSAIEHLSKDLLLHVGI